MNYEKRFRKLLDIIRITLVPVNPEIGLTLLSSFCDNLFEL